MEWILPGTTIAVDKENIESIEEHFHTMFLPGGMVLSQVAGVTGLETYTIQNWVKRGFLARPQQKRYSMRQLCRILNINMLKSALPMEDICGLLSYINGDLADESDDLIDDTVLYFLFVRLAAKCPDITDTNQRNAYIHNVMQSYEEPAPGAGERVEKVLRVMLTAWVASEFCRRAGEMLSELKSET